MAETWKAVARITETINDEVRDLSPADTLAVFTEIAAFCELRSAPPEAREERSGVERRVNTGCSCQRRPKAVACVSEDRLADRRTQPNRGRAARRET